MTLIAFQVLMLGIGWWASRRNLDSEDFYLGGRRLGAVVAALSASASSSSAWSLLGASGAAFAWGLPALWLIPSTIGGFLINWYFIAPRLARQSRSCGALNAAYPDRYKQFIVAGDTSHTALRTPLFYVQDANGVLLNEWTRDFLVTTTFWVDLVEPALP